MINPGDVIKVMEHPYSDQTYFVGEVIEVRGNQLICLAISRVRGGLPIPIDAARERFSTTQVSSESMHDRYRERLGRRPRVQRLRTHITEPVWRPGVA